MGSKEGAKERTREPGEHLGVGGETEKIRECPGGEMKPRNQARGRLKGVLGVANRKVTGDLSEER